MERKNLALLCAGVLCFWLFALAFGSAQGAGLRAVKTEAPAQAAAADAPAAQTAAPADSLSLPCRAAVLIEPASGRVLYEKNADERVPIASITKVMTCLLTLEAVDRGELSLEQTVTASSALHTGIGEGASTADIKEGEQIRIIDLLYAALTVLASFFGYARYIQAINFSLKWAHLKAPAAGVLLTLLTASALVSVLLALHLIEAARRKQLYGYAGALLSAVGGIALVSLLLAPRYYLHIHHSVWSLFLVFLFRYEKWWSRYAQALALGIYIDGLASWGLSSIWHLTS